MWLGTTSVPLNATMASTVATSAPSIKYLWRRRWTQHAVPLATSTGAASNESVNKDAVLFYAFGPGLFRLSDTSRDRSRASNPWTNTETHS